jgi:hypothetical protein
MGGQRGSVGSIFSASGCYKRLITGEGGRPTYVSGSASLGRLMAWRRVSIRASPIWMRLPSSESSPALRRAVLSARSASLQLSIGRAGFGGFAEGIVGQLKCEGTMCFAFFGPALGERFRRCIIAITTFLSGL